MHNPTTKIIQKATTAATQPKSERTCLLGKEENGLEM
jgi:hypothetical protein